MKYLLLTAITIGAFLVVYNTTGSTEKISEDLQGEPFEESKSLDPNNLWHDIRSYPSTFDQGQYVQRLQEVAFDAQNPDFKAPDLNLSWQQEGPGNIGGRFNALAISPTDQNIIYAGSANGGIFKTTDGGTTWNPIFDDHAYLAIGEIELDPNDENTVYVGTGDKNFGGGSHLGNGVYRSTDAGATWTQIGLEETAIITEIAVDPTNSNRIFVSTLGNTYEKTPDNRGVYRTTDGGASWQNVLFISDSSGVIDMVMDPTNSDILYATGFNRINLPFQAKVTGPDAQIYKTIDGGDNWSVLTNGLPSGDQSRIGLAISNVSPSTLYASYTGTSLDIVDIYKTTDAGATWAPLNVHAGGLPTSAQGGFGWYFGEVYLNPYDNAQLMVPGVDMFKSQDGGSTWSQNVPNWWDYTVHADKHAIIYLSATSYIIATDGGLYKTTDNGNSWTDIENIPVTQFYHIDVDKLNPGLYGGGAQDNGSMSGNASLFNLWERLYGGDGFRISFLENDPGGAYYETQNGGLTYQNSITFDVQDVSPNINTPDRVAWDMPYFINEGTSELFVGSSEIHQMDGAPYGFYNSISPDLTRVPMGPIVGQEKRHFISEIDVPLGDDDKMYVGTSDGLMWRGDRVGLSWNWTDITGTLPDRYVTAVRSSPNFANTVYVGMSGYKYNEEVSYLYKSTDDGTSWVDISANLPGITVNDILIVAGYDDDYLFAALDGGVYFTEDGGLNWNYVGTDLPLATISELDIDLDNKKLIAGTYSRSMWSYDVSWMDQAVDPSSLAENKEGDLQFYPNPVEELVYFQSENADLIELYDMNGNLVLTKKVVSIGTIQQVNLGSLASGKYLVKVGNHTGRLVKI